MDAELSRSARRVQDFLATLGEFEVREMPGSTRTSQEAADSIGCTVAQIAKSLVFRNKADDSAVLVVASGVNRVDVKRIKAATGLRLGRADAEFVRKATGYAIGGIPPVAHDTPLPTLLDEDLRQYEVIWAAAGTPHAVFRLTPDALGSMTGGAWLALREEK